MYLHMKSGDVLEIDPKTVADSYSSESKVDILAYFSGEHRAVLTADLKAGGRIMFKLSRVESIEEQHNAE